MKATLKVDLLKVIFIIAYLLVVLIAVNAWATGDNKHKKRCGASPSAAHIIVSHMTINPDDSSPSVQIPGPSL